VAETQESSESTDDDDPTFSHEFLAREQASHQCTPDAVAGLYSPVSLRNDPGQRAKPYLP
jgi:hypothetical protein